MSELDLGPAEVVVNDTRYVREATLFAAMERVDELEQQRDNLVQRLQADPDRAAIATIDGLTKLLREDEALGRLLDWVGVAAMDTLTERVLFLCAEYVSRTGQVPDVDTALTLGRRVLSGAGNSQTRSDT